MCVGFVVVIQRIRADTTFRKERIGIKYLKM